MILRSFNNIEFRPLIPGAERGHQRSDGLHQALREKSRNREGGNEINKDKLEAKSHAIFLEGIDGMFSNHLTQCNDGDATVKLLFNWGDVFFKF